MNSEIAEEGATWSSKDWGRKSEMLNSESRNKGGVNPPTLSGTLNSELGIWISNILNLELEKLA